MIKPSTKKLQFLLVLALLTMSLHCFGHKEKYLIVLKVKKIVYNGDSIVNKTPFTIEIQTEKASKIIETGKVGTTSFGVQIEILKSQLEGEEHYIAAKVYYVKKGNSDWEKIVAFSHSPVTVNKSGLRAQLENEEEKRASDELNELLKKYLWTGNKDSYGDPATFSIDYSVNYYKK